MNRYQMNSLNIEAEEDARQPPSNFVKYLTIFGSMAAVSFVAVTSIGSTAYTNSASATTNMKASVMERGEVPKYGPMEDKEKSRLFELFQEQYGRKYSDEAERLERYTIFKKFLDTVDHRNAMEDQKKGAVHGITKFADMTDAEFKKFLGYRPSTKRSKTIAKVPKYKGSATSVDWTGKYTTAVKDQGYCGSCWAFSATEQIESDSIRAGLLTTSDELSPQQIVSCDSIDLGCDGGNTETAYMYVMEAGGIDSATDYPYTSYWDVTGTCSVTSDFEVGITDFYNIEQDEDTMIDYVLSTGPLSVCLDASTWSSYTSGIVTAAACGTDVDHCVQAVGLNEDEGYWIVRNSWGTTWGLDGFIYLELGTDACLITTDPSYVVPTAV